MKELETLNNARLTHLEFGQHTKSIYTNITNRGETTPPIHDTILNQYLTEFNLKNQSYDKGMVQIAKSAETAKIVQADGLRDKALTCAQRYLSVFEFTPDSQEALIYASLDTVFRGYKRIQFWNFEEETNGIDNLVADLQSDKYSDMVETIGMTPYVNRMQMTNGEFKAIFNARTQEQAAKEVFDVKQLRSDLKISYEKLINYVLAMATATDNQEFNEILSIINTIRKYYSDLLARRKADAKTTTPIPS